MANLSWKRVGVKSGPANVLNDRYKVERLDPHSTWWCILDLSKQPERGGEYITEPSNGMTPRVFARMSYARRHAELLARTET